ncbi:MAG: 4Fe-4S dicluster domain-containing protein [Lewinella sp.]|uniref:4Fe-4S dicluster domain-containing protein n=1 Tax=Lewinella sp. TaxID=2004506 RepID=UPI003D6BBA7E
MANKKQLKSNCADARGKLMPLVNFNNCGAKEDCITVCPYDVFEMLQITMKGKDQLNLKGKLKTFFFKHKAYLTDPALCHACELCVQACPENAIILTKMVF